MLRILLSGALIPVLIAGFWLEMTPAPAWATPAKQAPATFQEAACPVPIPPPDVEGSTVVCGYLSVPEDRSRADSPMIQLAAMIFRSSAATPAPDPVFYLAGGPGGSGLADTIRVHSTWDAVRRRRDLIALDQRGTGASWPGLFCPEVEGAESNGSAGGGLDPGIGDAGIFAGVAACRQRLAAEGIDLAAYNSTANAADVDDLRRALGYHQVNLYGISYGTRLAQFVMRDYPHTVRSAVLDGVVPNDLRISENTDTVGSAFDKLFALCARDPACDAAYPHFGETFYRVVDQLNGRPLLVETTDTLTGALVQTSLTGYQLVSLLTIMLYRAESFGVLLAAVTLSDQGDPDAALRLLGPLLLEFDRSRFFGSLAYGMNYSADCQETAPLDSPANFAREAAKPNRAVIAAINPSLDPICAVWDVPAAPASVSQPLRSNIPTLLLSGELDPVTPASFARRAAQSLTNAYEYELPAAGHGVASKPCPNAMVTAFIADPSQGPDSSCIAAMPGITWLPPQPPN